MFNEALYYQFLDSIPYEKKRKDVNGVGFMALNKLPFKGNSLAVKYIMDNHPNVTPKDKPIIQDKVKCRGYARVLLPEAEYMESSLDSKLKAAQAHLSELRERWDAMNPKDLLESVHKELLEEEIQKQIGVCLGLSSAWKLLHDRRYELWECTLIRGGEENETLGGSVGNSAGIGCGDGSGSEGHS